MSKMFNETKFFTASESVSLLPADLGYDVHKQPTDQKCHFYVSNSWRFYIQREFVNITQYHEVHIRDAK